MDGTPLPTEDWVKIGKFDGDGVSGVESRTLGINDGEEIRNPERRRVGEIDSVAVRGTGWRKAGAVENENDSAGGFALLFLLL